MKPFTLWNHSPNKYRFFHRLGHIICKLCCHTDSQNTQSWCKHEVPLQWIIRSSLNGRNILEHVRTYQNLSEHVRTSDFWVLIITFNTFNAYKFYRQLKSNFNIKLNFIYVPLVYGQLQLFTYYFISYHDYHIVSNHIIITYIVSYRILY